MEDYRETAAGKRRFSSPDIYLETLEFQRYLRSKGYAWHNPFSDECTIDFDCCSDKSIGKPPVIASFPSERTIVRTALENLYEEIKHGDEDHQKWLKEKIYKFLQDNY